MKKILGLDIGTNSIGWALIERDIDTETGRILGLGSRIIPTDAELLSKYETGQAASKNAGRRQARGARRLKQRYKLRRDRLIKSLKSLGWLSEAFQPSHTIPVSNQTLSEMKIAFGTNEISDDWVVYFLRYKALHDAVTKEELARILYHMNQRRGFKSNRKTGGELMQNENEEYEAGKRKREKKVEIVTIKQVEDTGEKIKGNNVYKITLADGRSGTIARKIKPDWENRELELEITRVPSKKDPERLEFRMLNNTDADKWAKQKVAREEAIRRSGLLYPGSYYFHELKKNPNYVIKDVSIDRQFYIDELNAILKKQIEFNPSLNDSKALSTIATTLYPKNQEKQKEIKSNDITHLFIKDIIFFQRPLKSKKSSIADCRLAFKNYVDPSTGKRPAFKAAPISSPVFQEFRIWQTINNIRILKRQVHDENRKLQFDVDVTNEYLNKLNAEQLFELFDAKEKVTQKQILKVFGLSEQEFLINLFRQNEEKELPGNQTKAIIRKQLKKAGYEVQGEEILSSNASLYQLWHILYSLEEEKHIQTALQRQFNIPEKIAEIISKAAPFKPQYGSLSSQAMSRLLPLMRIGKHWQWTTIDTATQQRLQKIFSGEFDEGISDTVRDLFKKRQITCEEACQGMMVAMASYAVYGIHSEKNAVCYERAEQTIPRNPLNLRNPLVEQVVNETLRLVQDIWKEETLGRPDEIHIELARELKKNAKERKEISEMIAENENENKRIAAILRELKIGNPNSLADIERLKIWEKQADEKTRENSKDIKFKRPSEPTKDEIEKYKLWAQQKFISPYSGDPISISKLFTREYDIDHIIPRSRFFDDSLENKVVVETHLNKEKGNKTALEYIKGGSTKGYKILSLSEYEMRINKFFFRKKRRLLLSEDVPEGFSNRHLVDSRYISRKLHELLAPVATNQRDPVIVTSGSITSELKSAWGLAEKMKELVKWRFERLEEKTNDKFVRYEDELDADQNPTGRKILRLKGYEKRLDHRHHALDALIIACTTRSHIKYLNDLNAAQYRKNPTDEELKQFLPKLLEAGKDNYWQSRKFKKPWKGFVSEATSKLEGIVISFKNNIKLYGKKANKNWRYIQQADGSFKKELKSVIDESGKKKLSPYIRQSLHKATFAGKIRLREYKSAGIADAFQTPDLIASKKEKQHLKDLLEKAGGDIKKAVKLYKDNSLKDETGIEVKRIMLIEYTSYYVNRVDISSGFDEKRITKIPDPVLQKDLRKHIKQIELLNKSKSKDEQIDPFGSEGIELLNKNRPIPISKVTIKEESDSKFEIRPGAYTEADKGTNLFFVIYENLNNPVQRKFESIPLRIVIEAKAAGSGFVEDKPDHWWFTLSPGDLVYMPEENENIATIDWNKTGPLAKKIYKMVSCNKSQAFFVPQTLSKVIVDKVEFDSTNKVERALDGRMIKQHCIKLKVDRLGNIAPVK
jgi:CRISPR-associated endonuclease Csn1